MEVLAALSCPHLAFSSRPPRRSCMAAGGNGRFRAFCSRLPKHNGETKSDYKPGFVDDLLLSFFRKKMVEEVGWDSEKIGYDGLIEVVNRLMMKAGSNLEAEQSAVRILKSLFPPLITVLFKMLIAPIGRGQLGSMMVARVTALFCQWLMGACSVNTIELPDGSSCSSGVFVEKCKYLEESNCVGICINTCKLPTQTFFKDYMGIPLYMEPKFSDYSCQFHFGVLPPPHSSDGAFHEPCLETCPNAHRRKELNKGTAVQCPNA